MSKKSNVQKIQNLTKRVDNLSKRLRGNAPVAISSKNGNKGRDYYETSGCERISDVSVVSTSYNCTDVFINPANPALFPWLSGIANKYDLYHFKKLIFRYKPSLPTSEAGNVYLGIDYNTLDPAPPSSIDFCQLAHWTTNVVWKPNSLSIDVRDLGWLYTRSGSVPNADYKTYDLGRLFLATENISFASNVGYVEVEYQIEFKRRQPDYISVTPSTSDAVILSYTGTAASIHVSSGTSMTIPTLTVDTSNGEITVGSTSFTINRKGVYRLALEASSRAVDYRKNGTVLFNGTDGFSEGIVELNVNDVIDLYSAGDASVTYFSIVKLN